MIKIPRLRIFHKFVLVMILMSTFPIAYLGVRMVKVSDPVFKTTIKNEVLLREAASIAASLDEYVLGLNLKLDFAVAMELFPALSWQERADYIFSIIKSRDDFVQISMLNANGVETTKVTNTNFDGEPAVNYDRGREEIFTKARKTCIPQIGGVYYIKGHPRMNVVYPQSSRKDYVYIQISLQELWNAYNLKTIGKTGFMYLVDRTGRVICHPVPGKAEGMQSAKIVEPVIDFMAGKPSGSMEFIDYVSDPAGRKKVVGAYSGVKGLGWAVIVQQDRKEAYATINRMRASVILLVLAMALVSALAAFLLAGSMTRPISLLSRAAESFGRRVMPRAHEWTVFGKIHARSFAPLHEFFPIGLMANDSIFSHKVLRPDFKRLCGVREDFSYHVASGARYGVSAHECDSARIRPEVDRAYV